MTRPLNDPAMRTLADAASYRGYMMWKIERALAATEPPPNGMYFIALAGFFTRAELELVLAHVMVSAAFRNSIPIVPPLYRKHISTYLLHQSSFQ